MFDPDKKADIKRLTEATDWSRRRLEPYREKFKQFVEARNGSHWGPAVSGSPVPMNYIDMITSIYGRNLIPGNPRTMTYTPYKETRWVAENLRLALDKTIKGMSLASSLRLAVDHAMMGVGILYTGEADGDAFEFNGHTFYKSQLFTRPILLDDWVHDMAAQTWEQVRYMGHRETIPMEEAKELFGRDDLAADSPNTSNQNEDGDSRLESMGRGSESERDKFEDTFTVWRIWIPKSEVIVTLPLKPASDDPPKTVKSWSKEFPPPYRRLAFKEVAGNTMPLSVVANLFDMHELSNKLFNKLGRQAARQKRIGLASNQKDGQVLADSNDGEIWGMAGGGQFKEVSLGGVSSENLAFLIQVRDMMSWFAGNLDSLGGLGPMAETARQDELITKSASKLLEEMQDRVYEFTRDVVRDIGWYLWTDPQLDIQIAREVPGTDIKIESQFSAADITGEYLRDNIDIEPYSMQSMTPSQKVAQILQYIERVYAPLAQQAEAQGMTINIEELTRSIARLTNLTPELDSILLFSNGTGIQERSPETPKPANTTRTYERVNRGGNTTQGKNMAMMNTLLGGASKQERDMATRSVG